MKVLNSEVKVRVETCIETCARAYSDNMAIESKLSKQYDPRHKMHEFNY